MSNTKLSKAEKLVVKNMRQDFEADGGKIFFYPDRGITLAVMKHFKGANTMVVAVSVCSPDEQKYRKSVGARLVISRYDNSRTIDVPSVITEELEYFADAFVDTITNYAY